MNELFPKSVETRDFCVRELIDCHRCNLRGCVLKMTHYIRYMHEYLAVLKKYAVFEGRSRRKEFWMFLLIYSIGLFTCALIYGLTHKSPFGLILVGAYILFHGMPLIGVNLRRLHDSDLSGWFYLIIIVPYIGTLIVFILQARDSTPGDNKYGPNPKVIATEPPPTTGIPAPSA